MINRLYEHLSVFEREIQGTSLSPASMPLNPGLGTLLLTTLCLELVRMGERFGELGLSSLFFLSARSQSGQSHQQDLNSYRPLCICF